MPPGQLVRRLRRPETLLKEASVKTSHTKSCFNCHISMYYSANNRHFIIMSLKRRVQTQEFDTTANVIHCICVCIQTKSYHFSEWANQLSTQGAFFSSSIHHFSYFSAENLAYYSHQYNFYFSNYFQNTPCTIIHVQYVLWHLEVNRPEVKAPVTMKDAKI